MANVVHAAYRDAIGTLRKAMAHRIAQRTMSPDEEDSEQAHENAMGMAPGADEPESKSEQMEEELGLKTEPGEMADGVEHEPGEGPTDEEKKMALQRRRAKAPRAAMMIVAAGKAKGMKRR